MTNPLQPGLEKILVVEDDPVVNRLLVEILTQAGYQVVSTGNGRDALNHLAKNDIELLITDIMMPEVDGHQLVAAVAEMPVKPEIIVITAVTDIEQVISIMKNRVYDYILKPIGRDLLLQKVSHAFEHIELQRLKNNISVEEKARISRQISWWQFKDDPFKTKSNRDLFHSMHTSFSQGAGIGSLVTIINHILHSARKTEEGYMLDGGLVKLLEQNAEAATNIIRVFRRLHDLHENTTQLYKATTNQVSLMIRRAFNTVKNQAEVNNHSLQLGSLDENTVARTIQVNPRQFIRAFKELFINAFKFSEPGSKIIVFMLIDGDRLKIIVLNQATRENQIPAGYERLIFEPFFRLNQYVYEDYGSYDYGLGLCLVQQIFNSMQARIELKNMQYPQKMGQPSRHLAFEISFQAGK